MTVVPILCAHDLGYDDEEQEMQRTEIKHNDTFWPEILYSTAVDYSDEEKESILQLELKTFGGSGGEGSGGGDGLNVDSDDEKAGQ